MKIKKTTDYLFENDVLEYRSIVKGFTDKNYVEFDKSAHQSDLIRKIDDLLTGKIVNKSENQAAFHPKYRAYEQSAKTPKHLIDAEFYAAEFFNLCWNTAKDKGFDQINIISIGIGGSYEGPKLLLESLKDILELYYYRSNFTLVKNIQIRLLSIKKTNINKK